MNDFAVVAEGKTDQVVLRRILLTYYKGGETEPGINFEQPRFDATGEKTWREHGTWLNVLRYLADKEYRAAFQTNRYLVVQIDSGCSEEKGYNVPQSAQGKPLPVHDLIERVIARLQNAIGPADCAAYGDRFLFAVCVRDLECWLLPLWTSEDKKSETTGCLEALNDALAKANYRTINPKDKAVRIYEDAARGYKKCDVLVTEAIKNAILRSFLEQLATRDILIVPD